MTVTTSLPETTRIGTRPVRYCAKCGERAGSRSAGTGRPLHGEADGRFYHINCRPGAVVGIGAALGVDVVASGVETTAQLAVLESLGCGYAQGFLLSRPVGLAALVALLDQGAGQLWPGVPSRV